VKIDTLHFFANPFDENHVELLKEEEILQIITSTTAEKAGLSDRNFVQSRCRKHN